MSNRDPEQQSPDHSVRAEALIVPLNRLDRTLIPLVGGKAAQLGELLRAGFAVPAGFCITTTAYARVAASAELDALHWPNLRQPCTAPSCRRRCQTTSYLPPWRHTSRSFRTGQFRSPCAPPQPLKTYLTPRLPGSRKAS